MKGCDTLTALSFHNSHLFPSCQNALKYGFRPFKLLSGLTIGNPNIPLALCYPTLLMLILLSLVTELLAHKFLLLEAKVRGVGEVERNGKIKENQVSYEFASSESDATSARGSFYQIWSISMSDTGKVA